MDVLLKQLFPYCGSHGSPGTARLASQSCRYNRHRAMEKHLTRVCVQHTRGNSKDDCVIVQMQHNAALFYNPNQDVKMALQGDFDCLLDDDGFILKPKRSSERHGRTPDCKTQHLKMPWEYGAKHVKKRLQVKVG